MNYIFYLANIFKELESPAIVVGGFIDHIHILCMLSKKIALAKLVEELKSNSSKWIKTKNKTLNNFYWQTGYGAFSVTPEKIGVVIDYIENQHEAPQQEEFSG